MRATTILHSMTDVMGGPYVRTINPGSVRGLRYWITLQGKPATGESRYLEPDCPGDSVKLQAAGENYAAQREPGGVWYY
jgi:hypothetical protein